MVNNTLGIVYKLFIILDICFFVILFILYFFVDVIYKGLTVEEIEKLRVLYIIVGSFSVFSFPFTTLSGVFTAYEKFIPMKLCDMFNKIFTMCLIIFALISGLGVVAVVSSNAVSGIITIIIKIIILKKQTPIKINFSYKSKKILKDIFAFSLWVTAVTIAERLIYSISPTIIGIVSNSEEIAFYSPASMISNYLYTIAIAINGLFLPKVSRNIAQNNENANLGLMIKVGRYQIVVLGLCVVGFVAIGKGFISEWISPRYTSTYYSAIFLMIAPLFDYPQQIAKTTLVAKGLVKWQAMGLIAGSIINVPLSLIITSRFGSIGTAFVICIVSILHLIYMNFVYIKILKIDMREFYKQCYLKMIIPITASILIMHFVNGAFSLGGWTDVAVKGVITAAVYGVMIIIFFTNKQDVSMLKALLKGKK